MKVLAASVDHFDDRFANSPTIKLVVDRLPERESLRWRRWPTRSTCAVDDTFDYCYVGRAPEVPEYHRFFFGDPDHPGLGFGGTSFTVKMENGEVHTVVGPGAGGPYLVLPSSGITLCDVAVAERDGRYSDIYFSGCGFPPAFVAKALQLAPPPPPFRAGTFGWALANQDATDCRYEPVLVKGRENFGKLLLHAA